MVSPQPKLACFSAATNPFEGLQWASSENPGTGMHYLLLSSLYFILIFPIAFSLPDRLLVPWIFQMLSGLWLHEVLSCRWASVYSVGYYKMSPVIKTVEDCWKVTTLCAFPYTLIISFSRDSLHLCPAHINEIMPHCYTACRAIYQRRFNQIFKKSLEVIC